ncbi:MAG: tetratricopeptide repeat protein [Candidatus Eremiobacteraeota bacterium]|nr:tetratricopeptide repeat protein [Candidatus Eremiobacteraeota bacterium]
MLISPRPAAASAGLTVLVQTWDPKSPDLHPVNQAFDDPTFFDKAVNQAWALGKAQICTQLESDLGKPNVIASGFSLYNMSCTMASSVQVSIVGPATKSKVTMQFVATGNEFDASSTQPYVGSWGDPAFSVTYDMTANVTLNPLPQPQVTNLTVTVSNANVQTKNTIADVLKALDGFFGTGFLTKAQQSIDTTKKLDPSVINGLLAGVQTPLSQANQFGYIALWHHNDRIVVDLAPVLPDTPRPASISGVITWAKSGISISDCSKIQLSNTVQLGPDPLTLLPSSFGAAPTDTFGSQTVSSGAPQDMGDHYQCQYTYSSLPNTLPNTVAGTASGTTGQKNTPILLSYLKVKPSNWNGTVNLNGPQNGLNFEVDAATAALPYNVAVPQMPIQNPGPLHENNNPNIAVNPAVTQTNTTTLAQNAALSSQLTAEGSRLAQSGNLNGAASAFSNALALKGDNQVALLNLGLVHLKMGQTATAKNELQHALQLATQHGDTATAQAAQAALRTITPGAAAGAGMTH